MFGFQEKIASLSFLDPACGSGNFLTETYLCLRRLENGVMAELNRGQTVLGLEGVCDVKVSLGRLNGIEINDFARARGPDGTVDCRAASQRGKRGHHTA